jgi:hypothetical protein
VVIIKFKQVLISLLCVLFFVVRSILLHSFLTLSPAFKNVGSINLLDDRGFESWQGLGIFFFTTASRQALELTQPPIQCVPEAFSLGVKQPGREADHSPPSSAEGKNAWSYTSTPPIRLHGVMFS